MTRKYTTWFALGLLASLVCDASGRQGPESSRWHDGAWDSTLYAWSDPVHPRTVGVRFEVVDSKTLRPVPGVSMRLAGAFDEERLGISDDPGIPAVQRREFELTAETAQDGVVVFALSWQKEYPWSLERPLVRDPNSVGEGLSHARSWIRPVDDIEKVQTLEIRHPRYAGQDVAIDFGQLVNLGQAADSEFQQPEVFARFTAAWQNELRSPAVKFCVLRLGEAFPDRENRKSAREEFFGRIRRKDFGVVYETPSNLTSLSQLEYAGPYLVYLIRLGLEPVNPEVVLTPAPGANQPQAEPSRRTTSVGAPQPLPDANRGHGDADARRAEEEARKSEQERREREQAEQARRDREQLQRDEPCQNHLGVAASTLTDARRQEIGLYPGSTGVFIEYVQSGAAGATGGLHEGDVIESWVHRLVSDKQSFLSRVGELKKGDQVVIGIWRKGSTGKWERANKSLRID